MDSLTLIEDYLVKVTSHGMSLVRWMRHNQEKV
jgi:hypothetical protein